MDWNLLMRHDCLKDAAELNDILLSNISAVCRCVRKSTQTYKFAFELLSTPSEINNYITRMKNRNVRDIKPISDETRQKLSESHKNCLPWNAGMKLGKLSPEHLEKTRNYKKIYQYDMNDNLIGEYASIKSAKELTGSSSISRCAKGRISHSGGFKWRYTKI